MRRASMVLVMMLGWAASAAAQDAGSVGLTMGYPASIGVIWHVSDRIALRPEVSLTQISSTSTSIITIAVPGGTNLSTTTQAVSDQWSVGYGASALIYLQRWDSLRTYVSPRFQYARGTSTSTTTSSASSFVPIAPSTTEFAQNAYFFSGSFGAQYNLGPHFALFGELGFGFQHASSESDQAGAGSSEGHTLGTRSGVGVILYF